MSCCCCGLLIAFFCVEQILILIFAEVLGLYGMRRQFEFFFWTFCLPLSKGLIVALIMNTRSQEMLVRYLCLPSVFLSRHS